MDQKHYRMKGYGMTTIDINAIVLDTKAGCESNGVDFLECVREFFNCHEADVDAEGDIWIAVPQSGHWIDADAKALLIEWLNL
jgi:hypothetical protein